MRPAQRPARVRVMSAGDYAIVIAMPFIVAVLMVLSILVAIGSWLVRYPTVVAALIVAGAVWLWGGVAWAHEAAYPSWWERFEHETSVFTLDTLLALAAAMVATFLFLLAARRWPWYQRVVLPDRDEHDRAVRLAHNLIESRSQESPTDAQWRFIGEVTRASSIRALGTLILAGLFFGAILAAIAPLFLPS